MALGNTPGFIPTVRVKDSQGREMTVNQADLAEFEARGFKPVKAKAEPKEAKVEPKTETTTEPNKTEAKTDTAKGEVAVEDPPKRDPQGRNGGKSASDTGKDKK